MIFNTKRIQFLSVIALIGAIFVPSFAFAVSPLDGLIQAPVLEMPKILSCTVEGSIKRTSNTTNQISYKVHYGSNYPKLAAAFSVVGSVDHTTAVVSVYSLSGNTTFKSAEGYLYFNGKQENTFTFPIKNNPGVNVRVTVDGVVCAPLFFKTIQPLAGISSSFGVPVIALDPNASISQNGNLVPSVSPSANAGGTVNNNDAAIGGVVISQSGGNSAQGGSVAPSGGNAPVAAVDQGAQANSVPAQDTTSDPVKNVVIADETGNSTVLEKADELSAKDASNQETESWQAKDVAIVGLLGSIFMAFVVYIVLKYRGMM